MMRIMSLQLEIRDRPREKTLDHVLDLLDRAPASDLFFFPNYGRADIFPLTVTSRIVKLWKDPRSGF